MFPLNSNMPYIKDDGKRDKLGNVIGSGGGGGSSYTPDYENDRLIIGVHGVFNYYIPMSKEYLGETDDGYIIKTNPESDANDAKIDLYKIAYVDGNIYENFVKTIHHDPTKGDNTYSDDNISIYYSSRWYVQSNVTLYNLSGVAYDNPLDWSYQTTVDYTLLLEDPV